MGGSIDIIITESTPTTVSTASALAYITANVAANVSPTLDGEDLSQLLELAKRVDSEGRDPSDTEWEATWDLSYAILEGWRRKLGKATGMHNFSDGGVTLSRQQVFANIERMVDVWSRRVACGVTIPTDYKPLSETELSEETYE